MAPLQDNKPPAVSHLLCSSHSLPSPKLWPPAAKNKLTDSSAFLSLIGLIIASVSSRTTQRCERDFISVESDVASFPRDCLAFCTEPVFASLSNVLGQWDNLPSPVPSDIKEYKLYDVETKYGLLQVRIPLFCFNDLCRSVLNKLKKTQAHCFHTVWWFLVIGVSHPLPALFFSIIFHPDLGRFVFSAQWSENGPWQLVSRKHHPQQERILEDHGLWL